MLLDLHTDFSIINICLTDQTDKAVNDQVEHPTQAEEDRDIRVEKKKIVEKKNSSAQQGHKEE